MKNKNYKIIYLIIFILILCSFLIYNSQIGFSVVAPSESYDIIIIAGQSNSIGYGTRNHSSPRLYGASINIPDDNPSNMIKMYCNNDNIINASHPFEHLSNWDSKIYVPPKTGPTVGNSSANCNAVGFGLTFSKKYLISPKKTNTNKVLIIGCGYGGTGFSGSDSNKRFWWKPEDNPNYTYSDGSIGLVRSLYLITKEKITNMSSRVGANSKVVAILWHQGEYDKEFCMRNQENKNRYITDINRLFSDLRSDIVELFPNSTSVPILIGGLSPELDRKRNREHSFRTDNNSNATSGMTYFIKTSVVPSITNAHFVSCEPISGSLYRDYLEGDNELDANGDPYRDKRDNKIIRVNRTHVHFSATSLRELGKRYAYIFDRI
jgi:hypothetical protein